MEMIKRLFLHLGMFAIVGSVVGLFYTFYLLFVPIRVITLNEIPIPVSPKVASPSSELKLKFNYCKYINVPSNLTFSFIDQKPLPIFTTITYLPTGCHIRYIPINVPMTAIPDTIKILIQDEYKVNSLRYEHYSWFSEPIKIIKGGGEVNGK